MRGKNTGNEMIKGDEWVKAGEREGKETKRKKEIGVYLKKGIMRLLGSYNQKLRRSKTHN